MGFDELLVCEHPAHVLVTHLRLVNAESDGQLLLEDVRELLELLFAHERELDLVVGVELRGT